MTTSLIQQSQEQSGLVVAQPEWERKLALVKQTVAPGLTNDEFELFCHVAKTRNLDPLQRQIHAVKRRTFNNESKSWEEKLTIQIGIDGFRAIANRTGLYMPSDKTPLIEGSESSEMRATVWVKKYHRESKTWNEFGATAYYREFVQLKKDGNEYKPVAMWAKMPLSMTEKCAEAKALRRGWPEELGQIYIPEEINEQPQTLDGKQAPAMTEKQEAELQDYADALRQCDDEAKLKSVFADAYRYAGTVSAQAKSEMTRIYNECKARLA
jgi:phage recombination protein Bet